MSPTRVRVECTAFKSLYKRLMNQNGDLGKVLVSYLNDVSLFLCMIQAVRQSDINMHFEEERHVLPLLKAYNHWIHYFRYILSTRAFYLFENKNDPINQNLIERGFGASYSGDTFSSVLGDLVTEYLNREM